MENLIKELKKTGMVDVTEEQYNQLKEMKEHRKLWSYSTSISKNPRIFRIMDKRGFDKNFWQQYIDAKNNGDLMTNGNKVVRINGSHWVIGPVSGGGMRGYGGHKFVIEFIEGPHKGEIITTTNLWYQGEINPKFINQLPDNAKWVKQYVR
jgi:hypothetical protein